MDAPVLVLGSADGDQAALFRYGFSYLDGDLPFLGSLRTAEAAIAGVGGKVTFHRLFLAVTFTHPFHIRLTPIVDGKTPVGEYADIQITQADFDDPANILAEGTRATHLFEVSLSVGYVRGGVERFRRAIVGSYFQVQIEQVTPLAANGELILESLELEYEVITQGSVQ